MGKVQEDRENDFNGELWNFQYCACVGKVIKQKVRWAVCVVYINR